MNDNLTAFWRNTWSAWRAGELSTVSPKYKEGTASFTFERWLTISAAAKNPFVDRVFSAHPPQPGEFLIAYSAQAALVMTNQRIWMFGKEGNEYCARDVLDLANIAQFDNVRDGDCFDVTIRLRDNAERKYQNIVGVPSDEAIKYVIERCNPVPPLYELLHDPEIIELLQDPKAMICPSCRRVSRPIRTGSAIIRAIGVVFAATICSGIFILLFRQVRHDNAGSTEFVAGAIIVVTIVFAIAHIRTAINQLCPLCNKAELISRSALEELEGQKQENLFHYSVDGGETSKGPISIDVLYSLYNSNRIPRTTSIRKSPFDKWQRLPIP